MAGEIGAAAALIRLLKVSATPLGVSCEALDRVPVAARGELATKAVPSAASTHTILTFIGLLPTPNSNKYRRQPSPLYA